MTGGGVPQVSIQYLQPCLTTQGGEAVRNSSDVVWIVAVVLLTLGGGVRGAGRYGSGVLCSLVVIKVSRKLPCSACLVVTLEAVCMSANSSLC